MFSPGKEIVAIRNHPDGVFKRGEIFIVRDTRPAECHCHDFLLHVGFSYHGTTVNCACMKSYPQTDGIRWFSNRHFALLESQEGEAVLNEYGELLER